ncbi:MULTISPECIES: hypothetical protein [unclassified Sphingobacterium]|uniref:hypothetical protein n=1 Tax=unclassified Sphingobacterium TaxID=2609468 RepID=UPI0010E2E63D|nr:MULTISPECIES: hypothetical protein [unclassified Sphingobacterium]MCS3556444.1 phage-related holin [Sphingobacterium sp. JUb21]TCR08810.1 hypothetical protein EDF66_103362 [Sphingobacterium sp. JUb20]
MTNIISKLIQSRIASGILLANLFAMTVIGLQSAFGHEDAGILIFSEFVIIPMLMGIISTWYWKNLNLKGKQITGYSIISGIIAIALSYFFLNEGVICLLIVSPLIFGFIISGAFIGRAMFKRNNQKLNVSLISILILIFIVDSISDHDHENMVSDKIVINATPEEIWQHVVAFDKIENKENYWLFKIGMPSPMATTVSDRKLGANRKCIFSNGYIFDETIVEFDINKNLTFDIIDQPKDPEIMGHIDITKGQFLLHDNGDGTTTLTGNSWYKLHVFPTWYYDLWAESITRNVHFRVMEHVKVLSES